MSNTIDKQKLVDEIDNDIRTFKELGEAFDERRDELIAWKDKIQSGAFDIPNNHLQEALERIATSKTGLVS